jgi:multiple sugar transport system ATP-binding protein
MSAPVSSPAVALRGVSVSFGSVEVLKSLDLDVGQSEFLVLLGPSGCGKSTLLNAIAGLIDVERGQIFIAGRNVTWEEPKDRGIAMVFQSYALYPRMTVRGNMSFGLKVQGLPADQINERVKRAAEMLRITELLDRRPSELSGGQRQRVAIGRAVVREAPVFLFDEPLSNLDAQLRAELRVEIKRLHQRVAATMIYVTHDQIEALTLADRIAVMKDHVIQQLGPPQEIYLTPRNRFVASFVGSPAMNFIEGTIVSEQARPVFRAPGIAVALDGYAFDAPPGDNRPATLGIRPEHICLADKLAEGAQAFTADIEMVEPMGSDALAWTRLGTAPLSVRLPGDAAARVGDPITFGIPGGKANLFDATSGRRL